jgi:uncharacterized protein YbbK (DUF523 family)/uncharacterized protein YbgA (DUF1722 family)
MQKPIVAISSCLLGQSVRYNGGHKRDKWLVENLSPFVTWLAVCPEVELGLGVPREPITIEREGDRLILRAVESGRDLTSAMTDFAHQKIELLRQQKIVGYVFKSKSPSCGLTLPTSEMERAGVRQGLFASIVVHEMPWLPTIEESSLPDAEARCSFLTRVFSLSRASELLSSTPSFEALQHFHRQHRLLLMAYSPRCYQSLSFSVGGGDTNLVLEERCVGYTKLFQEAFSQDATREGHSRALRHAASYFHGALSGAGRASIFHLIESYEAGEVALLDVLRLITRDAKRCQISYLTEQHYLMPFPEQLAADLSPR